MGLNFNFSNVMVNQLNFQPFYGDVGMVENISGGGANPGSDGSTWG